MYHFDETNSREHTGSSKWDAIPHLEHDIVPLTVADMEFMTCPAVIKAMDKRVSHGIFGYTKPDDKLYEAILGWRKKRFHHEVDKEEIVFTKSVIPALLATIRTCTKEMEGVLILSPVYTAFYTTIQRTNRKVIESPLQLKDGRYTIDFEDFEEKAKDSNTKLFMLCNPHNPVGRVWTKKELERIEQICRAHDVVVVADEIHSDLVFTKEFMTYAKVAKEGGSRAIICTSPTKTFNLAGIELAYSLIEDETLRNQFKQKLFESGHGDGVSVFGYVATIAAYEHGQTWLKELLKYLKGNFEYLQEWIQHNQPKIIMAKAEGTYLAWLDCRALQLPQEELLKRLRDNQVYVTDGRNFGQEGDGFVRVNLALPRPLLIETLKHVPVLEEL